MKPKFNQFNRILFIVITLFVCFFYANGQDRSLEHPDTPGSDSSKKLSLPIMVHDNSVKTNSPDILSLLQSTQSNKLFEVTSNSLSPSAPPLNDNFSSLQTETFRLSGTNGSATGTSSEATVEPGEPNHGGIAQRTVWYKWTAPQTGPYKFSIVSNSCPFPGCAQVLTIYKGSSLTSLIKIAEDVDSGSNNQTSEVFFQAIQGQEYKIVIDAHIFRDLLPGTFGKAFTLSWSYNCISIPVSIGQTKSASLSTTGCWLVDNLGNQYYTDFYKFTVNQGQRVLIRMNSSVFDTYLILYNSSLTYEYARDDNSGGGTNSYIDVTLPPGTFLIAATSAQPYVTGTYNVSLLPPPVTISGTLTTATGFPLATPVIVDIACPSETVPYFSNQSTTTSFTFNVPFSSSSFDTCKITPRTTGQNNLPLSWSPSEVINVPRQVNTFGITSQLVGKTVNVIGKINNFQQVPSARVVGNYNSISCDPPSSTTGGYNCFNIVVNTTRYKIRATHPTANFSPQEIELSPNLSGNDLRDQDFTPVSTPNLSIINASITEGDNGTKNLEFTVSLSAQASQNVTVNYSTAGGTAQSNVDFQAVTNGILTIPFGVTTGKAVVPIIGDTLVEPDETFTVTLTGAQGAAISSSQATATGTITNDDFGGSLQFSAANYTVNENGGTAVITVMRTGGAASGVTVNYATSNGTATAGQDYTATSGTLTFSANETSRTFSIPIINDTTPNELDETINLTLSSPGGGGSLGTPSTAVLTIIDDDRETAVIIKTGVSGLSFTVDGAVYTSEQSFTWTPGSPHTIGAASPQNGAAGTRYVFTGWSDGNTQNPRTVTTPASAVTYTANFRTEHYLTMNASPANGGTISPASGWRTADETLSITATANSGFSFGGWTGTGSGSSSGANSAQTITMNSPITQTANFTSNPANVSITIGTNPSGRSFTVDGTEYTSQQTFQWQPGSQHSIGTAAVQNGNAGTRYVWSRWSNGGAASHVITTPASSAAYTAEFTTQHQLTTGANPSDGGAVTPLNGSWYDAGQQVLITATPNSGFVFAGWTGSGTNGFYNGGSNPATVTMNGPISQTANFTRILNRPAQFDFDGDRRADTAIYRPSDGTWHMLGSQNGYAAAQFGIAADRIVPGDYDGDGKTDMAVWRDNIPNVEERAYFYILLSSNGVYRAVQFGRNGDVPLAADFDGDGKADPAVYRPGAGGGGQSYFFYLPSSQPGVDFISVPFGLGGDKPVIGDYDGDGKADPAVYRPSNGVWYVLRSRDGFYAVQFGIASDKPVPADYDGDGITDQGVFRPSNGVWYVWGSTAGFSAAQFGISTDLPVAADYDGDGKADISVYRSGVWFILRTASGFYAGQFGIGTDKPVPGAFVQ